MRQLFPEVHHQHLDLRAIKDAVDASKVFYYDAIDEDEPDAKKRAEYLDQIRSYDGFHVRQGDITGKKERRRQKRVDVQLAVECLMHAYNKTIWHATLFAGDLDFEPLVSHLVNVGVHVHVYYEPRSGAKKLHQAADVGVAVRVADFWNWSTEQFRKDHFLPKKGGQYPTPPYIVVQEGRWKTHQTVLMHQDTAPQAPTFVLEVRGRGPMAFHTYADNNKAKLLKFFGLQHGPVEWEAHP